MKMFMQKNSIVAYFSQLAVGNDRRVVVPDQRRKPPIPRLALVIRPVVAVQRGDMYVPRGHREQRRQRTQRRRRRRRRLRQLLQPVFARTALPR